MKIRDIFKKLRVPKAETSHIQLILHKKWKLNELLICIYYYDIYSFSSFFLNQIFFIFENWLINK